MSEPNIQHLFVDEAGDLALFNKRGASIVGRDGVSRYFALGVAWLPNPAEAERRLSELRRELLSDPYFTGVPSMAPAAKKTALCFHAKDDVAEVRREMFKLLPSLNPIVQIVVRSKSELVVAARALHRRNLKLRPDDVYDEMVRHLFQNLSQQGDVDLVVFARRGKAQRLHALVKSLSQRGPQDSIFGVDVSIDGLRSDLLSEMQRIANSVVDVARSQTGERSEADKQRHRLRVVFAAYPHNSAGLQVIDYYLWALQRLYERREDRFFNLLAQDYRLIIDLDDQRNSPAGEWYSASNPLSLDKIKPDAS